MEAGVTNCVSGKIGIVQYWVAQIVAAWLRENGEKMKRKWRENEEMERK